MANEAAEQADIQQANAHDNAQANAEKPKPSLRRQRQLDRLAKIKEAHPPTRVRVMPRDDKIRANIRHPRAGAFAPSGSTEWPHDTFTKRRIAEGAVTVDKRTGEERDQDRHAARTAGAAKPSGGHDPQRRGSAPTSS